jgi:hypothetical protein
MTYDTSTQAGRDKRFNEFVREAGHNGRALVRLIGGSVEDFDERFDPSMSGAHPDDIRS